MLERQSAPHLCYAQKMLCCGLGHPALKTLFMGTRFRVGVTNHEALQYLYSMQDISNMLTRWPIALQSFDFTVQHKPGKLHVVPDTISQMFAFEHQQEVAVPSLVPICRNVEDDPKLQTARVPRPYHISADKLDNLEPVRSDRELFKVKSVFVSESNVFSSVYQEKPRSAQTIEYGRYIDYIQHADASFPEEKTTTTMSYFSVQHMLIYILYLPGYLRKRNTLRDRLIVPEALVGFVLHAYHDNVVPVEHLEFRPTYEKVRQKYWWPTISRDVREWGEKCQSCQRQKTAHKRRKLPTGHCSLERPFQVVSVSVVKYKSVSTSAAGIKSKYTFSS